jgi:hypothetical protein
VLLYPRDALADCRSRRSGDASDRDNAKLVGWLVRIEFAFAACVSVIALCIPASRTAAGPDAGMPSSPIASAGTLSVPPDSPRGGLETETSRSGSLTLSVSDAQAATACGSCQAALSLDQLALMSWPQLEALYRQSTAGTIPRGFARGLAIYCPESRLAGVRSRVSRLVWRGKVFDDEGDALVNQWIGVRAIRASVYYGPSWLDGEMSIVMDYSGTSRVWSDVRDEIREVAPGLYLGRMYRRRACGPQFKMFFALEDCEQTAVLP